MRTFAVYLSHFQERYKRFFQIGNGNFPISPLSDIAGTIKCLTTISYLYFIITFAPSNTVSEIQTISDVSKPEIVICPFLSYIWWRRRRIKYRIPICGYATFALSGAVLKFEVTTCQRGERSKLMNGDW